MKEFRYKLSTAIHTPVSLNYTINKVLGNLYVHKFHLTNQCHICSFRYEVWDDGYTTKDGYISDLHKQKYGHAPKKHIPNNWQTPNKNEQTTGTHTPVIYFVVGVGHILDLPIILEKKLSEPWFVILVHLTQQY